MAKDPAATTGPVSDDKTADNATLLNKKNKYRDVQKVDARLREAVASGDENYVRSRLGGDRVLSEAESLLLLKARQEAQENVSEQIISAEIAEQQAAIEEEEEQSFTQWAQRYVADRIESLRRLDAQGRDSNGFKFFADFGYDGKGNYNDSFGGQLGADGIYNHPDGMKVDIRRGVVTHNNATYNVQTNEAIIYDEEDGYYVHMRRDENGKMVPVEVDGKPHIMTLQEKEQLEAQWRATNRPMSDAEYAIEERKIRELDIRRADYHGTTRNANSASSSEAGAHSDADVVTTTSRGRTGSTSTDRSSTDAPSPGSHIGITLGGAAAAGIEGAYAGWKEAKPRYQRVAENTENVSERTTGWSSQFQRREQRRRAEASGTAQDTLVQVNEADRKRLEERTSKFRSSSVPTFAMGEASRNDTATTKWVKDKDGGVWDDKGGYYDTKGGYWDKQGGYLDAEGNYSDQYGGCKAADGSYTDSKGNYVDPQGNLWLAGNDTDTPDFPKKEGVNYIDVLAKAAENRYGEMTKSNSGLSAEEAKTLQERLTKIDDEFKITKVKKIAGPQMQVLDEAAAATPTVSSFINSVSPSSAEAPTVAPAEKETTPVSLKRNTASTTGPRSSG
ncbi:MAG: hypothetical protein ACAH80_11270 [Alphaproteobacteria bacterium]